MVTPAAHAAATEALQLAADAERRQLELYREIISRLAVGQRQPDDSARLSPIMRDLEITYEALSRDVEAWQRKGQVEAAIAQAKTDLDAGVPEAELRQQAADIEAENVRQKELGQQRLNAAVDAIGTRQLAEQRARALGDQLANIRRQAPRLFE